MHGSREGKKATSPVAWEDRYTIAIKDFVAEPETIIWSPIIRESDLVPVSFIRKAIQQISRSIAVVLLGNCCHVV